MVIVSSIQCEEEFQSQYTRRFLWLKEHKHNENGFDTVFSPLSRVQNLSRNKLYVIETILYYSCFRVENAALTLTAA